MALAAKNIVLFMDGTWNSRRDETNVTKLEACCRGFSEREQVVKYVRGVGAPRYADFSILRRLPHMLTRSLRSGATGHGIRGQICEAYQFLCQNYSREAGDRIYLFGFSRGAFAARSLAGFAKTVGLVLRDKCNTRNIEIAYDLYEHGIPGLVSPSEELFRKEGIAEVPVEGQTDLPIYFMGLWDTVASLGLQRRRQFEAEFTEYHQHELPSNVRYARHALALHEIRKNFQPLILNGSDNDHKDRLRQVWFPGSHGDVGGGFRDARLSDVCLDWMADEAERYGLKLRPWQSRHAGSLGGLHCAWRNIYKILGKSVRDELVGRGSSSHETRATFDLHPSSVRRLLAEDICYERVSDAARDLQDVDIATVKLFDMLQRTRPSGSYAEALAHEIANDAKRADEVREQLTAALQGNAPLAALDECVLLRASLLFIAGGRKQNLLRIVARACFERGQHGDTRYSKCLTRVDALRDQLWGMSRNMLELHVDAHCPMRNMANDILMEFFVEFFVICRQTVTLENPIVVRPREQKFEL